MRGTVTRDPRVRRDGTCAQCKGPRKPPKKMVVPDKEYKKDPFCSTRCCRAYYGISLVEGHDAQSQTSRGGRRAA